MTVRGARPLSEVREASKMELRLEIDRIEAISELSLLLPRDDKASGEVFARLRTGGSREPLLRLGSNFQLDGEVVDRISAVDGVHHVSLGARRGPANLKLVA